MILLWHISAALAVAIAVVMADARLTWPLHTILVLVIVELIAVGSLADSWQIAIAAAILVVAVPWAVVASFIYVTRRLRRRGIVAALVPVIYFVTFGISVVAGVNSGVMPP